MSDTTLDTSNIDQEEYVRNYVHQLEAKVHQSVSFATSISGAGVFVLFFHPLTASVIALEKASGADAATYYESRPEVQAGLKVLTLGAFTHAGEFVAHGLVQASGRKLLVHTQTFSPTEIAPDADAIASQPTLALLMEHVRESAAELETYVRSANAAKIRARAERSVVVASFNVTPISYALMFDAKDNAFVLSRQIAEKIEPVILDTYPQQRGGELALVVGYPVNPSFFQALGHVTLKDTALTLHFPGGTDISTSVDRSLSCFDALKAPDAPIDRRFVLDNDKLNEQFRKANEKALEERVARSQTVASPMNKSSSVSVFFDAQENKFTFLHMPSKGAPIYYDSVERIQWGRKLLVLGFPKRNGGFYARGHALLNGNELTIQVTDGLKTVMKADPQLDCWKPFTEVVIPAEGQPNTPDGVFQQEVRAALEARIARGEVLGSEVVKNITSSIVFDAQDGKFVVKIVDSTLEHPVLYDAISQDRDGRKILIVGYPKRKGGFFARGHLTLNGSVFDLHLSGVMDARVSVDAQQSFLAPFRRPAPVAKKSVKANPQRTPPRGPDPLQTNQVYARPGGKRPYGAKPPQQERVMDQNFGGDDDGDDLSAEDLRRLRGEVPMGNKLQSW